MEDTKIAEMNEKTALQAAEEAEKEKVTDSDTQAEGKRVKLSKPYTYEDKTYTEFVFNFDGLIGKDMLAIEAEMAAVGEFALSPEISTSYLSKLAARAARVGSDVIENLPIRDFAKVKDESRNFLLSAGLAN
jgi:hypothetical protein